MLTRSSTSLIKQNALLGLLPPVPASLAQVATGCALPNQFVTSKQQMQSRSPHFARDTVAALKVVLPGFYCTGGSGEKTTGAATTYTASVEYPAGIFTPVTFGGAATGTATDGGMVVSDLVAVTVPKGALFWIQVFGQNTAGIVLKFTGLNLQNGAKLAYASSGLSDQTATGTITNSGTPAVGGATVAASGYAFYPVAILAQTTQPSFYLLGDSRTAGSNDAWVGANADQGNLARSIGPFAPYINGGVSGDTLAAFVSSHANRLALAGYCTGVVLELAINDVTGGASLATMQANINTIRGYFGAATPVYLTTSEPVAATASVAVSGLTASGTVCTATVASSATLQVGQLVTVSGATTTGYNGTVPITAIPTGTTFTYNAVSTPAATTAAGTVVYTDTFASLANQTTSGANATRVALNNWRRALPSGFKACFEIADAVEAGRDGGLWTAQYGSASGDGTHPWNALYLAIRNAGVITPATMV